MKVICLQENLTRGLQIVGRAVSTRGTLLSNVLLRTDAGRLKLTATNLEIGVNCWVPAKVDDEGAITVPAKLFTDFVNNLPAGNIELSLNVRTKTLHLKSGPHEANMKGLDAEEFPIIPAIPERPTTRIAQGTLRRMIREVAFVAATDDSRPVLTGVLIGHQARAGLVLASEELWSEEHEERMVRALARAGIAFEISNRYRPHDSIVKRAVDAGVRISLGSDGHSKEQVGRVAGPLALARHHGVKDNDLYDPTAHGSRAPGRRR